MTITGKSGLLPASTLLGSRSIIELASGMMSLHCRTDTFSLLLLGAEEKESEIIIKWDH